MPRIIARAALAALLLLPLNSCFLERLLGSLPGDSNYKDEGLAPEPGQEATQHGGGTLGAGGGGNFPSGGKENLEGLFYKEAVDYSTDLPNKFEFAVRNNERARIRALNRGKPKSQQQKLPSALCARGVRKTLNILFGRNKDTMLSGDYGFACQYDLHALNSGGLGESSGKKVRYVEKQLSELGGRIPEGTVVKCASSSNPSCSKDGYAGHAEIYMNGRFTSGANYGGSLCLRNNGYYTNAKIFVLEKV